MSVITKIKKTASSLLGLQTAVNAAATKALYKNLYLTSTAPGTTPERHIERELVVSLTTYGGKIRNAYLAVESLLHQTMAPNRVILWLDQEHYADDRLIPLALKTQCRRGLEIRLCRDVRSHTKLVPALQAFPEAVIISVDDDILYPIDAVERLVRAYQRDPGKIYFYRGHQMTFAQGDFSRPGPYLEWVRKGARGCSLLNVPTGVLGILYPPHSLHPDVTDDKVFLDVCPLADDLWFKAMSLMQGTLCQEVPTINRQGEFVALDIDPASSLQSQNVRAGANDRQIQALFSRYPLAQKLREHAAGESTAIPS